MKSLTAATSSLMEKFPTAFNPEDGNAEDKASHTKGFALANLLFAGDNALTPEQIDALPDGFKATLKEKKPLSEGQKAQLNAIGRLKMANHDRLIAWKKTATARIAELEKSLAEYEDSAPNGGKAGDGERETGKDFMSIVEDEIKAMDK